MFDVLSTINIKNDTDIAYGWIQVLFPAGDSPYGAAFAVFTGLLSMLGGLFLAWHVLQGIVMSAYTGKVLGQKFHQIWAPLRVVLGFGMLVPISGGFSSVHFLLRDVVGVAAVNLGNAPIQAYVAAVANPDEGKNVNVASFKGSYVFDELLNREVCDAVVQGLGKSVWSYFTGSDISYAPSPRGDVVSVLNPLELNNYRWNYGACGEVSFVTPSVPDTGILKDADPQYIAFAQARRDATARMVTTIRDSINKDGLGQYFKNHDVRDMDSGKLLEQLRTEGIIPAGLAVVKKNAVEDWDKAVSAASAEVYKSVMDKNGQALRGQIEKYGFMAAGGFERALSKASSISVSLANASPKLVNPSLSDSYRAPYGAAVQAVLGGPKIQGEPDGDGSLYGTNKSDEPMSVIFYKFAPALATMKSATDPTSGDPLGDMITFGHTLIAGWEAIAVGVAVMREVLVGADAAAKAGQISLINAATGGASGVFTSVAAAIALDAFEYVMTWFKPFMTTILVVGILHAYVLPMLPMIMVFIMGISWLIMFLEAAIAAVLWAFVFIRMDGDDFVDRHQAQGASLLFNLFLRPAIGMLAFIGGLMLLPKLMNSLSVLWADSFDAQTSPDWTGVISWAVGLVLFTWMQWHLTLRLFGLIPTIADRVGSWMGFNSHGYNDGQETSAAVGAAVAAGAVGRTLGRTPKPASFDRIQSQKADLRAKQVAAQRLGMHHVEEALETDKGAK